LYNYSFAKDILLPRNASSLFIVAESTKIVLKPLIMPCHLDSQPLDLLEEKKCHLQGMRMYHLDQDEVQKKKRKKSQMKYKNQNKRIKQITNKKIRILHELN
jgi:hypothetical protein